MQSENAAGIGGGKYQAICLAAREAAAAQVVLLIVLKGNKGSGFSVASCDDPKIVREFPNLLRSVANDMEAMQRDTEGN